VDEDSSGTSGARIVEDLWRRARDAGSPRAVALGVAFRGRSILVESILDETAGRLLYRPPGGGVDFGELAAEAVVREFREEMGVAVVVGDRLAVLEDIFSHETHAGHEVVFVFEVTGADLLARSDDLTGHDHGAPMVLQWRSVDDFRPTGTATLCPTGLAEILHSRLDQARADEEHV
jgi:ADP-ribose pyrophosphatase YjhB (NUDIX family)